MVFRVVGSKTVASKIPKINFENIWRTWRCLNKKIITGRKAYDCRGFCWLATMIHKNLYMFKIKYNATNIQIKVINFRLLLMFIFLQETLISSYLHLDGFNRIYCDSNLMCSLCNWHSTTDFQLNRPHKTK